MRETAALYRRLSVSLYDSQSAAELRACAGQLAARVKTLESPAAFAHQG
jgi:hypothetical protein